ncbi:MAG: hypothetical protein KTR30_36465 [Saprospiraceae bacterium]|nr:hypothetical protein [Saprospiraceae bacterium]
MIQYLKISFVLLGSFLYTGQATAHDPSQITYDFKRDGTLQIHLTPKGAVDLLTTVLPDLEDQSVINPNEYYDTFTAYFNETIDLKLEEKSLGFSFLNADLAGHDAVMTFQVDGFAGDYTGYRLMLKSFTDVYRRISNQVKIELPQSNQICQLGQQEQRCAYISPAVDRGSPPNPTMKTTLSNSSLGWVAGASFLVVLLFLYVKPK